MNIKEAIEKLVHYENLNSVEMTDVMTNIMEGKTTPAQIAGFITALRMKGETTEEITAAIKVMQKLAIACPVSDFSLIDIVGTGGDGLNTFNISTATAFVVAAAGGVVAKHGNRSVSSQSGSADVLEALGANLNLNPEQVATCVRRVHIGFLFAPLHHTAMGYATAPRKEIGIRTLFNLLGPLTNPAQARKHLIGVFDKKWLMPFAEALKQLHSSHGLIVHSEDGLDEISINGKTLVAELKHETITTYTLTPEQFGISRSPICDITVKNAAESASIITSIFDNHQGPAFDIVTLNAGAALYAGDITSSIEDGVEKARETLRSGLAKTKLEHYIALTQELKHEEE